MENSVESQRLRRPRSRTAWGCPVSTIIVTILGLLLVFGIVQSYLTLQIDPQGCKTPSMLPTYIKLGGFDTEHTRFASKYNLYLYRERGVDDYSEEDIGVCFVNRPFPCTAKPMDCIADLDIDLSSSREFPSSSFRETQGATDKDGRLLLKPPYTFIMCCNTIKTGLRPVPGAWIFLWQTSTKIWLRSMAKLYSIKLNI